MTIRLKVIVQNQATIPDLLKLLCDWHSNVYMNLMTGDVIIQDASQEERDVIIKAISKYLIIVGCKTEHSEAKPFVTNFQKDIPAKPNSVEPTEETAKVSEPHDDVPPTADIVEPSQDSTEESTLVSDDPEVREGVRYLWKILHYTLDIKGAPKEDIIKYIKSTGVEIAMKYNPRPIPEFEVGDIVQCNFGHHLDGELFGGYVFAIVCAIYAEAVYLVPMTKLQDKNNTPGRLNFLAGIDVNFFDPTLDGGTILLRLASTFNKQRVKCVVGKTQSEFFQKLLRALPESVSFFDDNHTDRSDLLEEDTFNLEDPIPEIPPLGDEESQEDQIGSDILPSAGNSANECADEYITHKFPEVFRNINPSFHIASQASSILDGLGFDVPNLFNLSVLQNAITVSVDAQKLTYNSISALLHNINKWSSVPEERSISAIKDEFNKWLQKNPDIKAKYPKVSFMSVLKAIVKAYNKDKN